MTSREVRTLARFAVEGGRLTNSVVKPKLFEPNTALKLSVFRIEGLPHPEICALGITVVKEHRQARQLHGWGEISESAVMASGLSVDYDDVPPRHANILDWPDTASERKQKQQILASSAFAVRLNPPIQVATEVDDHC